MKLRYLLIIFSLAVAIAVSSCARQRSNPIDPESRIGTIGGMDVQANVTLSSTTPSNTSEPPVVTMRWEVSPRAILNYEVQRTIVANSTKDADNTEVGTTSLELFREDNTATRGQTYYYRVRARNVDNRVSDWTTPLAVTVSN